MDDGACAIPDPAELRQVRRQALWVHMKSLGSAIVLTSLLLVA